MNIFYEQRQNRITILRDALEFDAHLHSQVELVYMRQGSCDAYIDGICYNLEKGDCLIVFPNRIHSYKKGDDDIADVFIVSAEQLSEYTTVFQKKLPVTPHLKNVPDSISNIFTAIHDCEGKFQEAIRWGSCTALIGMLFQKISFRDLSSRENKSFQRLLDYCNENFSKNISSRDVADAIGVSYSYVSHLFSDKLFIGFRKYINTLRINEALRLIDQEMGSLTEIAYEVGFSSIRTFNRVFLQSTGFTPSNYKKAIANKK